mgnify:FL=1
MRDKLIVTGFHYSFGWLRRPELDDENGYCYEQPDGDLVFTNDPRRKRASLLNCWEDRLTKERYLTFSPVPRPLPWILRNNNANP